VAMPVIAILHFRRLVGILSDTRGQWDWSTRPLELSVVLTSVMLLLASSAGRGLVAFDSRASASIIASPASVSAERY